MEEAELRSWIEKLQARLQACGLDSPQQLQAVLESLVIKKQSLCEMLQSWNGRLDSFFFFFLNTKRSRHHLAINFSSFLFCCLIVVTGCKTCSSKRKAGSDYLSLPAQAGTDRPLLMSQKARSVMSLSMLGD